MPRACRSSAIVTVSKSLTDRPSRIPISGASTLPAAMEPTAGRREHNFILTALEALPRHVSLRACTDNSVRRVAADLS
jgi:hypothetical protein